MATLIAANYQSESSTAYGFMTTWNIKLKNNTLYTLKCRYKWDKNGTSSTNPMACCLYESTWSYGGADYFFPETPTTYQTLIHKFTTPGDVSSYTFAIANYATDGAILSVDWYELWEGDATTFSLTDAIALSENKTATSFVSIGGHPTDVGTCTNTGYFSTAEPRNAIRSWMGYYYKTHSSASYGAWTYTYNHYSSASRSRTETTYDHYSNGKVVQVGSTTQTENATVTYADWSYNWTTTSNSTRSRTVTYSWSDYSSAETQTETGGIRYLGLSEEKHVGDNIGEIKHTFPANGSGSKTFTIYSHDYWRESLGDTVITTFITTNTITGASCSCDGFTCSVSGSTLTVTASNLGTTEKAYHKATIVTSKSGFEERAGYTGVAQEANVRTLSSVYFVPYKPDDSWVVDVTNGQWATCPASGGYVKAYGYANYTHTSGASLNDQHITGNASLTWSTGYNSWITDHSHGGYRIHSRGTTAGSARSSSATWSYGGKTSAPKTLTQAENKITSYNNPTFDMWWSTGTGSTSTPVSAGGGTSSAPTYSVYQTAIYSSGDTGEITPNITYKQFSIVSKDTAATASINESTGAVTFGTLGKTEQNANTHAVVKLTITSHGKTVSDEGFCHQAPNYKTPVYGDINIFNFYYATIEYYGSEISPTCNYTQTCSYSYSSGETESASNVSGQAGDGYTSFQRISGDSNASVNSSTGVVSWGTNTSSSSRSATIRVAVTRNGKTATKDTVSTQTGAPTYGSWEFVGISSNTIDPIPIWENAVFTCTYRRTTPSGGYETRNGTCSPSEYYNDGSGGSVWVSYYDPDGRYGGQKQFMLDSE